MITFNDTAVSKKDASVTIIVKQTFLWGDIQWVVDRMQDVLLTDGKIKPSEIKWTKTQKIELLTALSDELDAADLTIREDDPVYSDDQWCNADNKIKAAVFDFIWQNASEYWPKLIVEKDSED